VDIIALYGLYKLTFTQPARNTACVKMIAFSLAAVVSQLSAESDFLHRSTLLCIKCPISVLSACFRILTFIMHVHPSS